MYFTNNLSKTYLKMELYSIQFRLTFGIILIFTFGLSSFTIWTHKTMTHYVTTLEPQAYTSTGEIMPTFGTISLIWQIITVILTSLFIWQVLLPLRKLNEQLALESPNLNLHFRQKMPTEVSAIAKKWHKLSHKIRESQQQQEQLISDLSHELRTPLSMIYGYLQRSWDNRDNLPEHRQESLKMALEEALRMLKILNDFLTLARINNETTLFDRSPIILNDLLTEVVEMFRSSHNRRFELNIPASPVTISADPQRLREILAQLLNNAINYSPIDESITVKLSQSQGKAVMKVSDRGCGIPAEQQHHVFEPFYRVDVSRARLTGGSGLGLSIVKKLVENLGGTVKLQSKPDEGSTFSVILPIY